MRYKYLILLLLLSSFLNFLSYLPADPSREATPPGFANNPRIIVDPPEAFGITPNSKPVIIDSTIGQEPKVKELSILEKRLQQILNFIRNFFKLPQNF